jgi:thymidine kinase
MLNVYADWQQYSFSLQHSTEYSAFTQHSALSIQHSAFSLPSMDITQHRPNHGWIEVITGSMFSGKREELIRRLRRAQIARRKVQIFKPRIDSRYADDHITSHSEMRIPSENLVSSRELLDRVLEDTEVVGIDEGQFFDAELPAVCNTLADQGRRVIVAGLDQDYLGKPFEPMPQLLAIAEYITKTLAICMVCGAPANHTQRLVANSERVLVGAQGTYEARCRQCFDPRLGR